MILALDEIAAVRFFRTIYRADRRPGQAVDLPEGVTLACRNEDVWSLAPTWITPAFLQGTDGRVGCFVLRDSNRHSSATHVAHTLTRRVPSGSFYDLGNGCFIPSPELAFLKMANRLSVPQLIALGDELCGTYSFDESQERGFRNRTVSLTTKQRIENHLREASGCKGVKQARRALRYMVDGSASPMETVDEMRLCLPYGLGGYGFDQPVMNQEIRMDECAAKISRLSKCYADLLWPGIRLVIEHQGRFDHLESERYQRDRARTIALETMGYAIFEFTSEMSYNIAKLDAVAFDIARRFGKRLQKPKCGFTPERKRLVETLWRWNSSGGHW